MDQYRGAAQNKADVSPMNNVTLLTPDRSRMELLPMIAQQSILSGTSMLDHALDHARCGLPVFPCRPDKTPYPGADRDANGDKIEKTGGLYKATTDEATIIDYWTRWPNAMIGLRMGKASGLFAIDPDAPKESGDVDGRLELARLEGRHGLLDTLTTNTPGAGNHKFFNWRDDRPVSNGEGDLKGLGINVRGEGGYVIVPPSVRADGRAYEYQRAAQHIADAPEWLYEMILPKAPAIVVVVDSPPLAPADEPPTISERAFANVVQLQTAPRGERPYSERALNDEGDALAAERKGGRNIALNTAALKLGSLIGPGRLSESEVRARLFAAATANGLVADGKQKVLDTINSGLSEGLQHPRIIPDRAMPGEARAASATVLVKPATIVATPYVWKPASAIPRREWLYGDHLIRQFASATISPGGVGKSSLVLAEAIAMAAGRDLLGIKPRHRCKVWYWNGEDPADEIDRRIAAICINYGVKSDDLEGWLFADSGHDQEIIIASQTRDGAVIAEPVADALIATIRANAIDVLSIDPFISCHRVTENDNSAIELVAKKWARIAKITNCAIDLVHHTRKTNGAEVTVEDGRGASALIAAVRSARVLNGMTEGEANKGGVVGHRSYFKAENGKANLAPPPDKADWFHIRSVSLGNGAPSNILDTGDSVGVVTAWQWPDPLAGMTGADFEKVATAIRAGKWREHPQATDWAGRAVAAALGLDVEDKTDKARIGGMLRAWLHAGTLKIVDGLDGSRHAKKFIEVAEDV
jgi:hypothetical protein